MRRLLAIVTSPEAVDLAIIAMFLLALVLVTT